MNRLWIIVVALLLSSCAAPGEDVQQDASRVIVSVSDERYGDCIPKDKRDQIAKVFEDAANTDKGAQDPPDLPRECGSSDQDQAMIAWDQCNDEYEGADIKKATAHARSCEEKFPPPD